MPAKNEELKEFTQFIDELSQVSEFAILDPFMEEWHVITNKATRLKIVEWVESQTVEFDEEATLEYRKGTRCGCAYSFVIEISPSNSVVFNSHNIYLFDEEILYRRTGDSPDPLQHPLAIIGVFKEAVTIKLSHDKAVLLMMIMEEMEYEELSDGVRSTVERVRGQLEELRTEEMYEDYEGFRKKTEEKAEKYYW
ncbi:hypothetical protein P4C99_21480 [Pontiellaceae bacterium B1224]|nr:hypothetical protein [Pontiellaceae bacterium B1224]